VSCDRDHSLTASTNSGQHTSLSRLPAWQAKRCYYVINVCAIETRFRSLPAAARIWYAYMHPHPAPIHCTGVGPAAMTAAFDAGVIGGRDQIHAAHGRTHA